MIQAARSEKQNILEGSQASGTSKEAEIKLTNVARASLEELLEDYRDYLRTRGHQEWPKEHSHTRRLRELNRQPNADYETFKRGIEHPDPIIAANVLIGLIKLTNYLLDQQLERLNLGTAAQKPKFPDPFDGSAGKPKVSAVSNAWNMIFSRKAVSANE